MVALVHGQDHGLVPRPHVPVFARRPVDGSAGRILVDRDMVARLLLSTQPVIGDMLSWTVAIEETEIAAHWVVDGFTKKLPAITITGAVSVIAGSRRCFSLDGSKTKDVHLVGHVGVAGIDHDGGIGGRPLVEVEDDVGLLMWAERSVRQAGPGPADSVVALEQAEAALGVVVGSPRTAPVPGRLLRRRGHEISLPSSVPGVLEHRAVDSDATGIPRHVPLQERVLRIGDPGLHTPGGQVQLAEVVGHQQRCGPRRSLGPVPRGFARMLRRHAACEGPQSGERCCFRQELPSALHGLVPFRFSAMGPALKQTLRARAGPWLPF